MKAEYLHSEKVEYDLVSEGWRMMNLDSTDHSSIFLTESSCDDSPGKSNLLPISMLPKL